MTLTNSTRILIVAAGALVIGAIFSEIVSEYRIASLERLLRYAENAAAESRKQADGAEMRAAEFQKKIQFLEEGLAGIAAAAKEQNEQIEKNETDIRNARGRVDDRRSVRAKPANVDELCKKLAELGYECS